MALFGFIINPDYVAPPNDGWMDVEDAGIEQDNPTEREVMLNDVLGQLENPQAGAAPVDPVVAEAVVQNILQQDIEQPSNPAHAWLDDIDNYVADDQAAGPSTAAQEGDKAGGDDEDSSSLKP